jgi:hypothetical protein
LHTDNKHGLANVEITFDNKAISVSNKYWPTIAQFGEHKYKRTHIFTFNKDDLRFVFRTLFAPVDLKEMNKHKDNKLCYLFELEIAEQLFLYAEFRSNNDAFVAFGISCCEI